MKPHQIIISNKIEVLFMIMMIDGCGISLVIVFYIGWNFNYYSVIFFSHSVEKMEAFQSKWDVCQSIYEVECWLFWIWSV